MKPKKKPTRKAGNLLLQMHPLQRIGLSLALCVIVFFLLPRSDMRSLFVAEVLWITFSASFLMTGWFVLFKRTVGEIRRTAVADDGSKVFVFVMIILSSFASLLTVMVLLFSGEGEEGKLVGMAVAIAGMLLSWLMVHTVFIFHYAHMYYDDAEESDQKAAEGLEFPREKNPDYIDFAYFAFVIGTTFQVSDVEVTSRKIRRLVMLHGLLSFGLNTFVVALTINMIAGLK